MTDGGPGADIRLIASSKNWIEGEAVRQFEETAKFRGITRAVALPDLHPGKGIPIGAAFASVGWVYPHLVGNDIGCGMGVWQTDLPVRKLKAEKVAKKLTGLDEAWDGDTASWLEAQGAERRLASPSLGTIGGGNHFAELLVVETLDDKAACDSLGVDKNHAILLVHSGSRGLGESILSDYIARFGSDGLATDSDEFQAYITAHDGAVAWAAANRALIAQRVLECLGRTGRRLLDLCHNSVTPEPDSENRGWLHRKGAAPSNAGPVVIPGSRGAMSYLVRPTGDQAANGWSVAHGAGRKWRRSDCKGKLSGRYRPEDLKRTDLDGIVICEDKALLYEEAPQSYKNIETVVADLVEAGIVEVMATLRPVISYKTRRR